MKTSALERLETLEGEVMGACHKDGCKSIGMFPDWCGTECQKLLSFDTGAMWGAGMLIGELIFAYERGMVEDVWKLAARVEGAIGVLEGVADASPRVKAIDVGRFKESARILMELVGDGAGLGEVPSSTIGVVKDLICVIERRMRNRGVGTDWVILERVLEALRDVVSYEGDRVSCNVVVQVAIGALKVATMAAVHGGVLGEVRDYMRYAVDKMSGGRIVP